MLDDCGVDVVLAKVAAIVGDAMRRYQADAVELSRSTTMVVKTAVAPGPARTVSGTRLAATWALAADGAVAFDADVDYAASSPPLPGKPLRQTMPRLSRVCKRSCAPKWTATSAMLSCTTP